MDLKEFYEVVDGNYSDMMGRLMTEERIKKFLNMFLRDESFETLCDSMQCADYVTAFRAAHTLKGTCLNLGLEKLRKSADEITEALRGGTNNGADELFPQVIEDYNFTISAIKQLIQ